MAISRQRPPPLHDHGLERGPGLSDEEPGAPPDSLRPTPEDRIGRHEDATENGNSAAPVVAVVVVGLILGFSAVYLLT